jgi:hypothetical protein
MVVSLVDRPSLDESCSGGCYTSLVSWHLAARYMVAQQDSISTADPLSSHFYSIEILVGILRS